MDTFSDSQVNSFDDFVKMMSNAFIEKDKQIEKKLKKIFRRVNPLKAAAVFCGLSSNEKLQSDHIKISNLIHASLKFGKGKKDIKQNEIRKLFRLISHGTPGRDEDPSEDVFISRLCSWGGAFNVFEGNWESSTFYLERFVNIVDGMPDTGQFLTTKRRVYALLKVSDYLAKRNKCKINYVVSAEPHDELPLSFKLVPKKLRNKVKLLKSELTKLGIEYDDLSPFIFDVKQSKNLAFPCHQSLTEIDKKPLLDLGHEGYFLFPQGVSTAIRTYILSEHTKTKQGIESLTKSLVLSYSVLLQRYPFFKGVFHSGGATSIMKCNNLLLQELMIAAPKTRPIHIIIVFAGFDSDVENWPFKSPKVLSDEDLELELKIENAKNAAYRHCKIKHGLTLVLFAGWGGFYGFGSNLRDSADWSVRFMAVHDFCYLMDHPDMKPDGLWRIIQIENKFESMKGQIQNVNGFLNLYGWLIRNNWHIVPHEDLPRDEDKNGLYMLIPLNEIAFVRADAKQNRDRNVIADIDGNLVEIVRYSGKSYFREDQGVPLYFDWRSMVAGDPVGVFLGLASTWWCKNQGDDGQGQDYQIWESAINWLKDIDRVFFENEIEVPEITVWSLRIENTNDRIPFEDQIHSHLDKQMVVHTKIIISPNGIFNQPDNAGERLMIQSFLSNLQYNKNKATLEDLISDIIPNDDAKHCHVLLTKTFNDFIRESLPKPVLIEKANDAYLRLGIGWTKDKSGHYFNIVGKEECRQYLNEIVDKVWKDLDSDLVGYNRNGLCIALVNNLESIKTERNVWERTIRACLALHKDKANVIDVATERSNKFNASSIATRLLAEMAICTCPLDYEDLPDEIELSVLLGKAILLFYLGSWSDAICSDLFPPEIKISAYGQIMMNYEFETEVLAPFQGGYAKRQREVEAENYDQLYESPINKTLVAEVFPSEFLSAWEEEFYVDLDQTRLIIDALEDYCIEKNCAAILISKSEIIAQLIDQIDSLSKEQVSNFLSRISLPNRKRWDQSNKELSSLGYHQKDWYPWNFRRKLSMVSKPVLELDSHKDPTLLIGPGIIRESFSYLVHNSMDAIFDERHFDSPKMKKWIGCRRADSGKKFNDEIAAKMRDSGWDAESDVLVTKILNSKTSIDYGDVDVLAWSKDSQIVLAIECKDLFFAKTHKETGNQINEFLGQRNGKGKRDRLLKHFDRLEVLNENIKAVSKYVGFSKFEAVHGALIFSQENIVEKAPHIPKDRIYIGSKRSIASPTEFKEKLMPNL